MLSQSDALDIHQSLNVIRHIQDDESPRRVGLIQILEVLAFILTGAKELLIRKDGKPKTKTQILLSIIPIIAFICEVIKRINALMKPKPLSEYKSGKGVSSK